MKHKIEPRLSVIIASYNYGHFICDAIDSALALDWPDKEIIVVDDGSTDETMKIVEAYRERVAIIRKENGGQASACNLGFAACTGELVLFLDADDMVSSNFIREAMKVWSSDTSKVQCQMLPVDANGAVLSQPFPAFRRLPSPADIRTWALRDAAYPTPPGSGNLYSRAALEAIFPLDLSWDAAADSSCLAAAPFLGKVQTIRAPLVKYRVHGGNQGSMDVLDLVKIEKTLNRAYARARYSSQVAERCGFKMRDGAARRSIQNLAYRTLLLRLDPKRLVGADRSKIGAVGAALAVPFRGQGLSLRERLLLSAWNLAVLAFPIKKVHLLGRWRFVAGSRPKRLSDAIKALIAPVACTSSP